MARMGARVAREVDGVPQQGYSAAAVASPDFSQRESPEHFAKEAARQAIVQLAVDCACGRNPS
jgi:hypothetical protein